MTLLCVLRDELTSESTAPALSNPKTRGRFLSELRKGNGFFEKKAYKNAIDWYTKAIAAYDQDHTYYSNRSASYAGEPFVYTGID